MSTQSNSEIKFAISLDENKVPQKIDWSTTDSDEKGKVDALLISMWDNKEKNTLRIDLWTKEMLVDDMKQLYHQTLLTMADTFARATGEDQIAAEMRNFAQEFGEKMGLVKRA